MTLLGPLSPDCTTTTGSYVGAALSGAATRLTGLDRLLPLPPLVHHAAGGVAYKAYCVGGIPAMNQNTAVLAACGAGGAILSGMILG